MNKYTTFMTFLILFAYAFDSRRMIKSRIKRNSAVK